jgi:LuxR family maltose regulon positive regulatory protein
MKNILNTRLIRPKNKGNIITRKDLNEKLEDIINKKLTIVSGGPAVGKTTLISMYLENSKNYIWISLGEEVDDIISFWTYFIYGVKEKISNEEFYIDMLNSLMNRDEIFNIISSLINELIDEEELIIVFDDFYFLKDKFLLATIEYFIKHSTDEIHFVLISREEVHLYIGDLIMKGEVKNLNGEDFKISKEDTINFFKENLKKQLSQEEIDDIYEKTEGWIGAIRLVVTLINDGKNFLSFSRDNSYFIEYVNKELLGRLHNDELDFLIKTSSLKYVDAEVCSLLGNGEGEKIIDNLIKKNMMIISIDSKEKSYRYHNVLRDVLIGELNKWDKASQENVINKLIEYLIYKKNYDEALTLSVDWKLFDKSLSIIHDHAHLLISTRIFRKIPLEYYKKSLDLSIISVFYSYFNIEYERGTQILNALGDNRKEDYWNVVNMYEMVTENMCCNIDIESIKTEVNCDMNILARMVYYMIVSFIFRIKKEYILSLQVIDYILEVNKEFKNSYISMFSEFNKVGVLEESGKIKECEKEYKNIKTLIGGSSKVLEMEVQYYLGLPGVFIKRMIIDKAEKMLIEGEKKCDDKLRGMAGSYPLKRGFRYNMAQVKCLSGNLEEGEKILNSMFENDANIIMQISTLSLRIELLSFHSNRIKKEEYEEYINLYNENFHMNYDRVDSEDIAYSIALFKIGKVEESLKSLDNIIFECRKKKRGYGLTYALIVKVCFRCSKNMKDKESLNCLKEALFYSRDEDLFITYHLYKKELKELFKLWEKELNNDKNNSLFLDKIYKLWNNSKESILSERELEVLHELAKGLSNKEIAGNLYVSLATVKTHLINIYSKLEVKNRVEAIKKYYEICI